MSFSHLNLLQCTKCRGVILKWCCGKLATTDVKIPQKTEIITLLLESNKKQFFFCQPEVQRIKKNFAVSVKVLQERLQKKDWKKWFMKNNDKWSNQLKWEKIRTMNAEVRKKQQNGPQTICYNMVIVLKLSIRLPFMQVEQ